MSQNDQGTTVFVDRHCVCRETLFGTSISVPVVEVTPSTAAAAAAAAAEDANASGSGGSAGGSGGDGGDGASSLSSHAAERSAEATPKRRSARSRSLSPGPSYTQSPLHPVSTDSPSCSPMRDDTVDNDRNNRDRTRIPPMPLPYPTATKDRPLMMTIGAPTVSRVAAESADGGGDKEMGLEKDEDSVVYQGSYYGEIGRVDMLEGSWDDAMVAKATSTVDWRVSCGGVCAVWRGVRVCGDACA